MDMYQRCDPMQEDACRRRLGGVLMPLSLLSVACAGAACLAVTPDSSTLLKLAPWSVAGGRNGELMHVGPSAVVVETASDSKMVAWKSADCPDYDATCSHCSDAADDTATAAVIGLLLTGVALFCDHRRTTADADVYRNGSVVAGLTAAAALLSALMGFSNNCYEHVGQHPRLGSGFYMLGFGVLLRAAVAVAHAFVPVVPSSLAGSLLGRATKIVPGAAVQPFHVRKNHAGASAASATPVVQAIPATAGPTPAQYKALKVSEQRARDHQRAYWAGKAQDPISTLTEYKQARGAAPARKFTTMSATAQRARTAIAAPASNKTRMMAELSKENGDFFKNMASGAMAAAMALNTAAAIPQPVSAITKDEINQLSYLQVKGTGLANRCVEVGGEGKGTISIDGKKQFVDMCIEPKNFYVQEGTDGDFIPTKLMTRQTYTLDGVSGDISAEGSNIRIQEKDGIDYAATTVQMPGNVGSGAIERVPFLFSVKSLDAIGKGSKISPGFEFGGPMKVPEYRTGLFLDPKGRGSATGYDMAQALPGSLNNGANDALANENNKVFSIKEGRMEFEVTKVDSSTGEVGGVFVSTQPSDTDLGSKVAKTILLKGIWYARIE